MNDPQRLTETVDRFCRFILGLPEAARMEQDWGPREVLAHLVFYHELYVTQVEAVLSGTPLNLPKGRFRELNAAAIARCRGVSTIELVERLQKANQRLVELYR